MTRSDTNQPVVSQEKARSFKFGFMKKRDCTICVAKTKALISFAVTEQMICDCIRIYANCWFSYAAAHIKLTEPLKDGQVTHFSCAYIILT